MITIMLVACTLSQISGRECRDVMQLDTMEHCADAMAYLLHLQSPDLRDAAHPLACEKRTGP